MIFGPCKQCGFYGGHHRNCSTAPAKEAPGKPRRVELLEEAASLTSGDRDREYGPPAINMEASGALKITLREHLIRDISPAEMEALDMALTKIGRLITGSPKRDTYVDAAAYLAIAGEIALGPET